MIKIELKKSKENYSLMADGVSVGGAWVGHTDIVPAKDFMNRKSKVLMGFGIGYQNRQKGFGQILMDKIIESEKLNGTEYIRLGVEKDNEAAIKIYERSGLIKDGLVHNMHYMWKKL